MKKFPSKISPHLKETLRKYNPVFTHCRVSLYGHHHTCIVCCHLYSWEYRFLYHHKESCPSHRHSVGNKYDIRVIYFFILFGRSVDIIKIKNTAVADLLTFYVNTAFRPVKTLGDVFTKPKKQLHENQVTGIVYKVECKSCPFVFTGESKRSCNFRGAEHKPGTRGNDESAIKQYAETIANYVEILERGAGNRNKRLFLESLHSTVNTEAVNERQPFPKVCLPLINCIP